MLDFFAKMFGARKEPEVDDQEIGRFRRMRESGRATVLQPANNRRLGNRLARLGLRGDSIVLDEVQRDSGSVAASDGAGISRDLSGRHGF